MKHNIDYTKLDTYLRLMQMGAKESTGKIQKGYGTIRIDYDEYHYIIIGYGRVERRPFMPPNASPQYLKDIKDIADRDENDYNDVFLFIIDKINNVRRPTTTWLPQMYQAKSMVFDTIFNNSEWIESYSARTEEAYKKWYPDKYKKWEKYSEARKLHHLLVTDGKLKKGRQYE